MTQQVLQQEALERREEYNLDLVEFAKKHCTHLLLFLQSGDTPRRQDRCG